ncbi:hypothetical protein [Entomomonas moraniae]|uniref:hypothetical protein n=1 Tax=Entomomonas moraniae TaxID=2213226 RepID=UPI0013E03AC4|nr:hypothetical protein [Entomomonas moraniae]
MKSELLVPLIREFGSRSSLDLWSNNYSQSNFTHQSDNYKVATITVQRVGNIFTC